MMSGNQMAVVCFERSWPKFLVCGKNVQLYARAREGCMHVEQQHAAR